MAVAEIQLPDGRIAELEVPAGMAPDALRAEVERMYQSGAFAQPEMEQPAPAASQTPEQDGGSWVLPESRERANMPQRPDASSSPALRVLGELAASANRSVTELVDFFGPDTVNAVLSLAGSETRVPTLTEALEPTGIKGGFMEPGAAREAVQAGGALIPAAAGIAPVRREIGTAASTVADLLGAGSSAVSSPIRNAAPAVSDALQAITPQNPLTAGARQQAKLPLLRKTGDADTFGFRLDEAGQVVSDRVQRRAGTQGFEEGLVTMVRDAPAKAREKMRRMVDIVERGKNNFRYQASNRPLDVAGDSITQRVKVVKAANQAAAQQLDSVAQQLKGQRVDVSPAIDPMLSKLDDMGIKFSPGDGTVSFQGSDLEGLPGPQRVIKNMLNRLLNTQAPDAYDVHRMKRFIDEQVTYGKSARGLGGRAERVMKTLRHDLDALLDSQFPEYNRVNTEYAETIRVLDGLQDIAGKRIDITGENADKALGTLSRRFLSNAQSRVPLIDAVNDLDQVARKYVQPEGTSIVPYRAVSQRARVTLDDLDDDLLGQVMFVDELEKMFGTSARTSLQGDIGKVGDRAIDTVMGSQTAYGAAAEGMKAGWRKLRGINEENALKAIKDLLRD